MLTQDDRLTALEQKVAALERQVFTRQTEHGRAIGDLQHDVTILLGMATKEIELTNGLRTDVSDLKEDVGGLRTEVGDLKENINQRFNQQDQRLGRLETLLVEVLARLPEKL